jgi:F-type H+-transporting ATPase subunit alpha
MTNTAEEILKKIEAQIDSTDLKQEFSKKWEIIEIKDGVAIVTWLENVMFSEIVEFENGSKWLVLDLLNDQVWILILWKWEWLRQWQIVKWTGQVLSIGVWMEYLWRVVDTLWNPVDWLWEIKAKEFYPVDRIAPCVMTRKWVDQPVQTWIKAIDALIPIGRWQRELIIW